MFHDLSKVRPPLQDKPLRFAYAASKCCPRVGPAAIVPRSFAIQCDHETLPGVGLARKEIAHHLLEFFNVNDATQNILIGVRTGGKSFNKHEVVHHAREEYVRGNAHINTAEGYFSQLKRSINGTYHHVSDKHLDRYLAEFDYRSTRKSEDGDRTVRAIEQTSGKRLMYRKPTGSD